MILLFKNQEYLIFLAGVMISSGIIKSNNYFAPLFSWILEKVKSKKLIVYLVSLPSASKAPNMPLPISSFTFSLATLNKSIAP